MDIYGLPSRIRIRQSRKTPKLTYRALRITSCIPSRYTVKKQETGVKLKMQDLRLFNLVFESDPAWILDFSNRALSVFLMKN